MAEASEFQKKIPQDCVQWNHQVRSVSDKIETLAYLRCMPGDVYHPNSFFVSLVEFWNPLEDMMADVQVKMATYLESSNEHMRTKLDVCQSNLIPGLYVMARHQHEWHRAMILRRLADSTFQVFLIDYGTERIRTLFRIKYMPKSILDLLPPQAVECRLKFDTREYKTIDWVEEKAIAKYIQGLFNEKVLGVIFNERELYFDDRCMMHRPIWLVNVNIMEGSSESFYHPDATPEEAPKLHNDYITGIAVFDVVRQLVRQFSEKFLEYPNPYLLDDDEGDAQ